LTLRGGGDDLSRLSQSIASARVDLNPHQVDAALAALRSPLSKGMILADEVGLGKTIEASLVIAQRWAERRRRILLILPATLRKQWQQELLEKFSLPCVILESKSYREAVDAGNPNPFLVDNRIVLCSYQFAKSRQTAIASVSWDLVVMDEAHRLRNIFKGTNKTAAAIAEALEPRHKLLLTATPLQNSLMELYGLVSIIDPQVFGDAKSFRLQYVQTNNETQRNMVLRERLKPLCKRTLRKQVQEYVKFTRRIPITQDFFPSADEQKLYDEVSEYLRRGELMALPKSQRQLITLVLRKLLASSTFAISGTLRHLAVRLQKELDGDQDIGEAADSAADFEALDELVDEWDADGEPPPEDHVDPSEVRNRKIKSEIRELRGFVKLAEGIQRNSKGTQLLEGLKKAFEKAKDLEAPHKAVIFTESLRTQRYLAELLTENGYAGEIVLISGANTDAESGAIYRRWLERHKGTDQITGSRTADMKAAVVEEFRDRATILIATESAAEGVNLQFCSLVVNYDLPWNPQRVEQRIGRCHRYGQKHDVVVVNFVNRNNAADQRVFQLLSEKFRLFDGVFGASDDVLGAIESGVDLEKRIAAVYQDCRSQTEIQAAFDQLQLELDDKISNRLAQTRSELLEHFDEEVHQRFRMHRDRAQETLNAVQRMLVDLTRQELGPEAKFAANEPYFEYGGTGYHLDWRIAEERNCNFYRPDHPLAEKLIGEAKSRVLATAGICFDYAKYGARVSTVEHLIGKHGWLRVGLLRVEAFDTEERILMGGSIDEDGAALEPEICAKLLGLPGSMAPPAESDAAPPAVDESLTSEKAKALIEIERRNLKYFDEEVEKLDRWADDLKTGLEREIKELDQQMREVKRLSASAPSLQEKLEHQKRLKELDTERRTKRKRLFEAQDEIDAKRDGLIGDIEQRLKQRVSFDSLMTIRWTVTDSGRNAK
jgi:superfamily II DNA or RNA helicase